MKTVKIFYAVTLGLSLSLLQSCVPDPPPKPIGYQLKKSDKIVNPPGGSKFTDPGPNCP
jgi:hypothetical protein